MKKILFATACALALSACGTAQPSNQQPGPSARMDGGPQQALAIANDIDAMPRTDMPQQHNVQTFDTAGSFKNPLAPTKPQGILENTTSGGYTVFDESVTVYPLPGEEAPAFLPAYAVPPLKAQYGTEQEVPQLREPGTVGKPIGLASAGMLPPVKNVEVAEADPFAKAPVSGQVRRPLTLTAPEPVTMQPPVSATTAPRSPFDDMTGSSTLTKPRYDTSAAPAPVASATPSMAAGRRSPSLTGY